jgi:pimeloyl-ACP methyl ester carboxylesterase
MPTRDERVDIEVDGQRLEGTLVTPARLVPGVLFVHGWGGSQQQYLARARVIAALGCVTLAFDLRGHAQTRAQYETVTRADNLRDVLAAYDFLARHRAVDPAAIAVVGSSYGGYLAAILTSLRPVKWLALRVPALYRDSGWEIAKQLLRKEQGLEAYRLTAVGPDDSRALGACHSFVGDVLIVESEHDVIVPRQVVANYREAFSHARSLTYRMIAGADHGLTDNRWQREYTELLVGWMHEKLAAPRGLERTPAAAKASISARAIDPQHGDPPSTAPTTSAGTPN